MSFQGMDENGEGARPGSRTGDEAGSPTPPQDAEVRRWWRRRPWRLALTAGALLGLVAFGVLLHRITDVVRGSPIRTVVTAEGLPPPSDPDFARRVGAATETPLASGHEVEVLVDEDVFAHLLADIGRARESITFVAYFCEPGRLGDRIAAALQERARAGVAIFFLGDGFSCGDLVADLRPGLEAAGVRVAVQRPVRWYALHKAQHRNHARGMVIDGRVAYTGGWGVADSWIGTEREGAWRDTSVRFTGPAVAHLQAAFLAAWAEATGALRADPYLMPPGGDTATSGDALAGLLVTRPVVGVSPAETYLALTFAGARRTLYIANSYFVPTPEMKALLLDAARRGVDVRVLVPGPRTDVPSTRWAGQRLFDELLRSGIRIWEYRRVMMHSKLLVVDGTWSTVGSLNLDNRSLRLNEEWSLLVHDEGVGATLDSLFLADLARAEELTLEQHRQRPLWDRVKELLAGLVAPLM